MNDMEGRDRQPVMRVMNMHPVEESEESDDLLDATARHEAGHAVMRWILGLPATAISIEMDQPGNGFCAGTGKRIMLSPKDQALFALAGPVAEANGMRLSVTGCSGEDWDIARRLIARLPMMFIVMEPAQRRTAPKLPPTYLMPEALKGQMAPPSDMPFKWCSPDETLDGLCVEVVEVLWPHDELVEDVAIILREKALVPARQVAAFCRQHGKRMLRKET
jgi:hypothetical protein